MSEFNPHIPAGRIFQKKGLSGGGVLEAALPLAEDAERAKRAVTFLLAKAKHVLYKNKARIVPIHGFWV